MKARGYEFSTLTSRQRQIATLVAQGMTNGEIAKEINLSAFTVRNEVISILRKLSAKNRSHMAFLVGRCGL